MLHVRQYSFLAAGVCFALLLCIGVFGADDPGSVQDTASASEGSDIVYEESENRNEETKAEDSSSPADEVSSLQDSLEGGSEVEPSPSSQAEPVEGEITEGQYRAYVLSFLLFFTVVIVCYFGYRFFAMFF